LVDGNQASRVGAYKEATVTAPSAASGRDLSDDTLFDQRLAIGSSVVSPELARHLVRPLIAKHPLPWRLDYDWTVEVYDATDRLVIKLMNAAQAQELCEFAIELAAYDAGGEAEVKKLFAEAGIED
jgi:hypothetical protein